MVVLQRTKNPLRFEWNASLYVIFKCSKVRANTGNCGHQWYESLTALNMTELLLESSSTCPPWFDVYIEWGIWRDFVHFYGTYHIFYKSFSEIFKLKCHLSWKKSHAKILRSTGETRALARNGTSLGRLGENKSVTSTCGVVAVVFVHRIFYMMCPKFSLFLEPWIVLKMIFLDWNLPLWFRYIINQLIVCLHIVTVFKAH